MDENTKAVWTLGITVICGMVTQIVFSVLNFLRTRSEAQKAAVKVAEVKTALDKSNEDHGDKLDHVVKEIGEVKSATNGMKADLVRVTGEKERAAGIAQGIAEQKEREQQSQ